MSAASKPRRRAGTTSACSPRRAGIVAEGRGRLHTGGTTQPSDAAALPPRHLSCMPPPMTTELNIAWVPIGQEAWRHPHLSPRTLRLAQKSPLSSVIWCVASLDLAPSALPLSFSTCLPSGPPPPCRDRQWSHQRWSGAPRGMSSLPPAPACNRLMMQRNDATR